MQELPFDAACLAREAPLPARIRRFINQHRRRRVPCAPILIPLARLAWLVWCPVAATLFVRRHRMPLFGSAWRGGVMDGWLYGRRLHTTLPLSDAAVMQVGHPTSFIIGLAVAPIHFTYDTETRTLVELTGRVPPKVREGDQWADFDARVEYEMLAAHYK